MHRWPARHEYSAHSKKCLTVDASASEFSPVTSHFDMRMLAFQPAHDRVLHVRNGRFAHPFHVRRRRFGPRRDKVPESLFAPVEIDLSTRRSLARMMPTLRLLPADRLPFSPQSGHAHSLDQAWSPCAILRLTHHPWYQSDPKHS